MKRVLNIGFIGLILSILFVPNVKATMQQGLMKLGFFNPKLDESTLSANSQNSNPETAEPANYTMNLIDEKGNKVSLEDLKGKVVFINFWATWCGPCIAEMPSIQKLHDKFKDNKDIVFVILEAEGNKTKATKFMENRKLNLPLYYPAGDFPAEFFRGSLPTTVILDKQGNIAHITEGMSDYSGQDIVDFLNNVIAMEP
ncbi:TlpA family protein disulfide reductase [Kaistella flava (ex Peng et al. 2021)]|uniref:TlpA family protein disulfide reductase n=2 Tax=Kaistella flava (ex Peng et al. 2021) TaxID=2038776 RepID=A0A7M2YCS7_9FLAO|nr:TlpA family protein disulfide reductase [Kaistella flava (ex Peng et al. 2021)]